MIFILKALGLLLAIVIPGGLLLMAAFVWVGPKILKFMMDRMEREFRK